MSGRRPVALLAAGAVLALPAALGACPPGLARAASPDGDTEALALLQRASVARDTTAYQGTQFVTTWGEHGTTTLLVDVGHVPGRGTAVEVRGTGKQQGSRYWARSRERATDLVQVGAAGDGALALLSRNYRVTAGDRSTVAGRPVLVVEAHRGWDTIAARFWLDEDTGLVLRREVYDEDGQTTSASAFLEIAMTAPQMTRVPPTLPESPEDEVTWNQLDDIEDDGWQCPRTVSDTMALYEARQVTSDDGEVLHLSYSDGLSIVSVFQQWGSLDAQGLRGYVRQATPDGPVWVREGSPTRVVWSAEGTVYTVLANAPDDVVDDVIAAWPHETPDNGFWARIARGLARVGSWFNPFG